MSAPRRRLAPAAALAAALAAAGCAATHGDVELLRNDLRIMRLEAAQADSARRARLDSVATQLARAQDSLRALSARLTKFQGDVRGDLYALGQQLIAVQELTGQSQRRLQELRGSLEQRSQEMGTPAAGARDSLRTAAGALATPGGEPGPNQLFQLSLEQLRRGSAGAARAGFQDLLRRYPNADVAPDAQFYLAESYAQEGKAAAADSTYAALAAGHPQSSRAPTALYKHALQLQAAGKVQAARAVLEQVIRQYPRSDEAILARERLRTLK